MTLGQAMGLPASLVQVQLVVAALLWGTGASPTTSHWAGASAHQPHILIVMTDSADGRSVDPTDQRVFPAMATPNMDRLRRKSANFVRTYSPNPLCIPSRVATLTGRSSDHTSVWSNGWALACRRGRDGRYSIPSDQCRARYDAEYCQSLCDEQGVQSVLFDHFQDAGWAVKRVGKYHIGADFGDVKYERIFGDPRHLVGTLAREARVAKPFGPGVYSKTTHGDLQVADRHDPKPPSKYPVDLETLRKCKQHIHRAPLPQDQGFRPHLLYCSFFFPHPPYDSNAKYMGRIDTSKIRIPVHRAPEDMHPADRYASTQKSQLSYVVHLRDGTPRIVNRSLSPKDDRQIIHTYYGMLAQVDDWVGDLLRALDQRADRDQWYVVYLSDHGEMAREHDQTRKATMYEGSVRVPLLIQGPGVKPQTTTHPSSLLDLVPTLLDLAGIPKPAYLDGESLVPTLHGVRQQSRAAIFSQYHSAVYPASCFMVQRSDGLKGVFYSREDLRPQVFNVTADPDELRDLVLDPARHVTVAELHQLLLERFDVKAIGTRVNNFYLSVYRRFVWDQSFAAPGGCRKVLGARYQDFDSKDAHAISHWSELPCTWGDTDEAALIHGDAADTGNTNDAASTILVSVLAFLVCCCCSATIITTLRTRTRNKNDVGMGGRRFCGCRWPSALLFLTTWPASSKPNRRPLHL